MPEIDLCFQGWVRGAEVTLARDVKGRLVNVSEMGAKTLAAKLNAGELFISLGDHLYDSDDASIEIFDFEAHDD